MGSDSQEPVLDITKGASQFGSEEVYLSILEFYVTDMRDLLTSLQNADLNDLDAYAAAAHSIKGASRNVFVDEIGDEAEKLEQAAKAGDSAYVTAQHEQFLAQAEKMVDHIEALRASKGL